MKCRLYKRPERGIALVITLVMLAIVTVMAIVFLGVSRRERASVKVVEDNVDECTLCELCITESPTGVKVVKLYE